MSTTGRRPATPEGRVALKLLEAADDAGVTLDDLRREGLAMPAQALYDVELSGWPLVRRGPRTSLRRHAATPPEQFTMPPKVRLVPRD